MRRALPWVVALAVLAPPALAGAQTDPPATSPPPVVPRVTFSLTATWAGYGDLQVQPVLAERINGENGETVPASSVLQRTMSAESGAQAMGSVTVALDRWWSVRAGVGVGRVRLAQAFAGDAPWADEAAGVAVIGDAGVTLTSLESALRLRLPSAHALRPYLEMGFAAERWQGGRSGSGPFPGADELADAVTRVGGHAAVGGHYPLTDRLAARGQASMRAFRTPFAPSAAGVEVGRSDALVLTFQDPAAGGFADASRTLVQRVRLELGISYGLGEVAGRRPDRSESDDSTPAPPR